MTAHDINQLVQLNPKGLGLLLQDYGLGNTSVTAAGILKLANIKAEFKADLIKLLKLSGISATERVETPQEEAAPDNFTGKPEEKPVPRVFGIAQPLVAILFILLVIVIGIVLYRRGS